MIDNFLGSACALYVSEKNKRYSRNKSWELCYEAFSKAIEEKKYDCTLLSLNLAFYLASWGMYVRNSFLLKADYTVHEKAVEQILQEEYAPLHNVDCTKLSESEELQSLLKKLIKNLEDIYSEIRTTIRNDSKGFTQGKGNNESVSSTLISKVLLGTLGCSPGYDSLFKKGIKENHIASTTFKINSIVDLASFYVKNKVAFEAKRDRMKTDGGLKYPQMKLLDMMFWSIGKNKLKK